MIQINGTQQNPDANPGTPFPGPEYDEASGGDAAKPQLRSWLTILFLPRPRCSINLSWLLLEPGNLLELGVTAYRIFMHRKKISGDLK